MRRWSRPLGAILVLSTLGGTAVPAVAQDENLPAYAAISGTAGAGSQMAGPTVTTSSTVPQEIGVGMAYASSMLTNDSRLSGRYENIQNYYGFLPGAMGGAVRSGVGRLTNEGGSWRVEFRGFTQPEKHTYTSTYYVSQYTGEGAYDGLSAIVIWLPSGPASWDVEGVLYPGEMPPKPDLPDE